MSDREQIDETSQLLADLKQRRDWMQYAYIDRPRITGHYGAVEQWLDNIRAGAIKGVIILAISLPITLVVSDWMDAHNVWPFTPETPVYAVPSHTQGGLVQSTLEQVYLPAPEKQPKTGKEIVP